MISWQCKHSHSNYCWRSDEGISQHISPPGPSLALPGPPWPPAPRPSSHLRLSCLGGGIMSIYIRTDWSILTYYRYQMSGWNIIWKYKKYWIKLDFNNCVCVLHADEGVGADCLVSCNWCLHNCHKGLQGCSSGEPHKYGQHSRYCVIVTTTSIISPAHCTNPAPHHYTLHFLDWHHCHCCFEELISQQSSEHRNGTLTWQFPVLVQLLTQNIDNPSKLAAAGFLHKQ